MKLAQDLHRQAFSLAYEEEHVPKEPNKADSDSGTPAGKPSGGKHYHECTVPKLSKLQQKELETIDKRRKFKPVGMISVFTKHASFKGIITMQIQEEDAKLDVGQKLEKHEEDWYHSFDSV